MTDRKKIVARLDKLCSEYVRKRAMKRVHGCERCGARKMSWKELDCAHLQRRGKYSTRWHDWNCYGLCAGCHRFIDDDAEAKVAFSKKVLGDQYERLLIEAEIPSHYKANDYALIEVYLRAKLKEYD